VYRDQCQWQRVAWQAACSPTEAGSLENYLLKRRGATALGEPPSFWSCRLRSNAQIRAEEMQTRYD